MNCPLLLLLGLWGSGKALGGFPFIHRLAASKRSRSLLSRLVLAGFVRAVVGQASGAMEDGQVAVGIFVDPDLGLDVVMAVFVFGDLQGEALVAYGVVVADGGFLLDAEDIFQLSRERHEGRTRLFRPNGETPVVVG